MTPDLNHSITIHNQTMKQWWRVPEYIKERKAFVKRNPVCTRCGRPATTPGHAHADYRDYETYLAAVVNDKCDPLCSSCNMMERKGKKPCPECIKQHKERIRYIGQDQERCFDCRPQEVKDEWTRKHKAFDKLIRLAQDKDNANRRKVYREIQRGTVKK